MAGKEESMYLHLGEQTVVNDNDIIGIFDIENTSISKDTRDFLRGGHESYRVVNVSYEMPKAFVVCDDGKETVVYVCQISAATLRKRICYNQL